MPAKRLSNGSTPVGTTQGTVAAGDDPRIIRGGQALLPTDSIAQTRGLNADIIEKISGAAWNTFNADALTYAPIKTAFVGDGVKTVFHLSGTPSLTDPVAYLVCVNGIIQEPVTEYSPGGSYTISDGNVIFTDPIPAGVSGWVVTQRTLIQSENGATVFTATDPFTSDHTGWKKGDIVTIPGTANPPVSARYLLVVDPTQLSEEDGYFDITAVPTYYTPNGTRVRLKVEDNYTVTPEIF